MGHFGGNNLTLEPSSKVSSCDVDLDAFLMVVIDLVFGL